MIFLGLLVMQGFANMFMGKQNILEVKTLIFLGEIFYLVFHDSIVSLHFDFLKF